MNGAPLVSIVIPAYNEEKRIAKSLEEILAYLTAIQADYELLIVDDGSEDKTGEIVEVFMTVAENVKLVRNQVNLGKGFSVKRGILECRGEYVIFLDADLSYPIMQMGEFLKPLREGSCDLVIGSRRLPGTETAKGHTLARATAAWIFNMLVRCLFGLKVSDTQCGFKCFRRSAALQIAEKQSITGFSFDVEMLLIARKLGLVIEELPTRFLKKGRSTLHLMRDGPAMLWEILLIKLNDLRGRYRFAPPGAPVIVGEPEPPARLLEAEPPHEPDPTLSRLPEPTQDIPPDTRRPSRTMIE